MLLLRKAFNKKLKKIIYILSIIKKILLTIMSQTNHNTHIGDSYGYQLLSKMSNAFDIYTSCTFWKYNRHFYIDTESLDSLISVFDNIHNLYNNKDVTDFNIYVKEDMTFKVFVLSHCIVRICDTQVFESRYKEGYECLISLNNSSCEKIYEIITSGKFTIIVSHKIIPLILDGNINPSLRIDFDNLWNDISSFVHILNSCEYEHGDVRLDNIGYDQISDKYVLFDFDKLHKSTIYNDIHTFEISLKNYMNKK